MNKLEGKIALITEGSTGIDLATAQRFVSKGASVSITGRRQRELDVAVSQNATAMQGTAHSRTRKHMTMTGDTRDD